MKSLFISAVVAAGLLVSVSAQASEGSDLAKASGCLACHAVDKKIVGPAYQDVAKKYTKADAAKLVAKVKAGGTGVWGQIPMPPNANVSEANVKKLVDWILAGAK
ncbi:MAG: c-type cytochrome [Rhodocyclaceae bacterium]|nr:c-type cytochrome [Rhodocyclaceae bacterium]